MISDRIKKHLEDFVKRLLEPVDYYAPYACKVVQQNSDGSVDLQPEDKRLAQFKGVPIHYGTPDTSAKIQSSARVMLEFENGDRQKPFVSCFDFATVTELNFHGGSSGVARKDDSVDFGKFKMQTTPGGGMLIWTSPDGLPTTIGTFVFAGSGALTVTPGDANGKGKIDSASTVVKAG